MKLLLWLPHLAFNEVDNLFRLRDRTVLSHAANDDVVSVEEDDRRGDPLRLGVGDDLRFAVGIDVRDGGEGCAEINSDCFWFSHNTDEDVSTKAGAFDLTLSAVSVPEIANFPREFRKPARLQKRREISGFLCRETVFLFIRIASRSLLPGESTFLARKSPVLPASRCIHLLPGNPPVRS